MIENFEENSSISSWIIDYYFTEILIKQIDKYVQPKNIIGCYDMWMIYRSIQPELSVIEFWNLCKNKLKKIHNDNLIEKYNNYLNRCSLIDIIDLFHQYQFDSILQTIIFSIKNIQNNMDRLFFEYLLELPSTSCDDTKTKLTTKKNLLQFIDHEKSIAEQTNNSKNDLKHTLCTYLSLLLDTRNEHALIHCLLTSKRIAFKRETIVELQCENLTIYQVFISFLRRQECSSLQYDYNKILEKYYDDIKEFFHFIEQLQMIIEENQCSNEIFRKLLELICKQLRKNYDDSVIEELCQCFQISGATLADRRLLAYLCAKQTIDLPILNDQHDSPSDLSPYVHHSNPIRKYRSLDLSIIHETSFESDSIINTEIDHKTIVKRQPLREIDINSFNIEEREIEYEKNPIVFTLISDGDKENLPVITKKRSLISTKNDPPNKKHKK